MATISFKSVGRNLESLQQEVPEFKQNPIGIKTPLQLSSDGELFIMNYSLEDQLSDNLRNLLQTNFGERLGLFNYGANLKPLTVNFSSQDDFDSEAISRIASAISRWMPYIDPIDYVSEVDRSQQLKTALIRITISYNIPSLDVSNKKIQIALYVI